MKTYRLVKIDLDNYEDCNQFERVLLIFEEEGELAAHKIISEFLKILPPQRSYLGSDGKVYPLYRIDVKAVK